MRIAYLADFYPPQNRGGAGVVAQRLARHFSSEGHEILVVSTVQDARDAGRGDVDGVRVARIYSRYPERFRNYLGVFNPRVLSEVGGELERFQPDVVHAHNVHHHLSFGSLRAAARTGAPVVLTSHDFLLFCCDRLPCTPEPSDFVPRWTGCARCQRLRYNPARRILVRKIVRSTVSEILAISDLMRNALELNGFERVTTVHNGIPLEDWPPTGHSTRESGDKSAGRPVVLLPGRLTAFKGTEALLDAVSRLGPSDRPAVVFAGDNPRYERALLAYAQKLGLRENVEITGWMDQAALRDTVSNADVVVTPSTYADPFNLGNIEAMSTARPVVASSLGGGPEIVVDGETGYLVNPADSGAFAARLEALLKDSALRRRFGLAGRNRVEERFTLARQASLTMESYLRAVAA